MLRQNFLTLLNHIFLVLLLQIAKSTHSYSVRNEAFYEKFSHSSEVRRYSPTHIIPKSVFRDHMDLKIENSALIPRNINNISEENNWDHNRNITKYDPIFKKSKLLQKRDLKIPELPKPEIPKLPSDLPSLPSKKDLPKIPSVDLPELPKVDLPNTSRLPDLQKIPKIDLPKITGVLNKKLYEPSDSDLFHKYSRNLQKRNLPGLPAGMPKLPELPKIPSIDLPELPLKNLPEIPVPSMPKMPEIPHISLLNHDKYYPSYGTVQQKKFSPKIIVNSPKTKRAVMSIPNTMPERDNFGLTVNEKNNAPVISTIINDRIKLMSVPAALPVLVPISKPMKPVKAAHKSYPRRQKNCDEEKVTYREKTKITIHERDSDESSSSSSSEENIFSKIFPKSWNPELLLKPLSPIQDTFSNARKSHTKPRREDECVDEIVIEDVTEIVLTGSDDSSERRLRDVRNQNDYFFSNLHLQLVPPNYQSDLIKGQHYSSDGLNQINTLKQRDARSIDIKKISSIDSTDESKRRKRSKPRRKKGDTIVTEEETIIIEIEEDIEEDEKQSEPKRTQETDIIEEEIVIVEIDEDKSFNKKDKKLRNFKGETKITEEKTVIDEKIYKSYENSEDEDDIEDDDSKRKKREALEKFNKPGLNNAQRGHEKIMMIDNPPEIDSQIDQTKKTIEKINLDGKSVNTNKNSYKNSFQKSTSETQKLREFFKQLQEKAKHSVYNVDVEINNNLLIDENSLKETNSRGKRSPVNFVAANSNSSTRRYESDLKESKLHTYSESEDLKKFFNTLREKANNYKYNVELEINERLLTDKNSWRNFNDKGTSLTDDHVRKLPRDNHEIRVDKLNLVTNSKTENLRNVYKKPREKANNSEYNAAFKLNEKVLSDRNSMEELNDRNKRSASSMNLQASKLKSDIKEQNFANSKLATSSETENLINFFEELREIAKYSEYNIEFEINEKVLREVGLISNKSVRNKRSPNIDNKNTFSTYKLNKDFPVIEPDLEGGDIVLENDINRDKRKASSDGKVELQEEVEITVVEVEEDDDSGSKTKTSKKTKTIEEIEGESSPEATTKKQTTTTTTTTTTQSTTSEFAEEEETTEYDYELDEEPCPTDFFGTAFQKVQCIFNSITSKVIGMEFGPGCC